MNNNILPHNHTDSNRSQMLREQLCQTENFRIVAEVFKQLSDFSRLRIFWLLCHCEECVTNISALVDMTSPAVSHHLSLLKANKLISSRRHGKEVYYKAAETEQSELLHLAIEKVMEISCMDTLPQSGENKLDQNINADIGGFRPEQIELINQIHEKLTENLDQRITIDELSKQFPINPSTMKTVFKAVYGDSIAAHIKEHRMEKAAELLHQNYSIAETAQAVGYDSQSKFTAEFKKTFEMLPSEYKKICKKQKGEG